MASVPTVRVPPLVLAAIIFTLLAWTSAFIVIRGVAPEIGGGALALGRLVVGVAALGIIAAVARNWLRPTRREWILLVLHGVAWFGAYNVTLNLAEATLDAGTTAMVVNIGPLLIALGAGLFLGEGVPRWLLIGASVSFAGVVLIGVGMSVAGDGAHVDIAGVLWALVAAVTYAIGVLVQKPIVRRLPAGQVAFIGCAFGMLACLPFMGQLLAELAVASPAAIAGMAYLGIVPTALAFTTWGFALARVPAGQLGVSTYIVPPLTVLAGWLAFGEVPTILAIVGGALCLVGVAISRRRDTRAEAQAAVEEPVSEEAVAAPGGDTSRDMTE